MEAIKDLIKIYLLIHGHSLDYKIVDIDDKMAGYIGDLSEVEYSVSNVKLQSLKRKTVLKYGREFYEAYFKVHDIYYATDQIVTKLNDRNLDSYEKALELFNKVGKRMSPFNLPVSFTQKEEPDCFLRMLFVDVEDEEFLKRMKPYFSGISLVRYPTLLTPSSYIHELGHLQIESNKCSIVDCNNSEVFPIFLEFLSFLEDNDLLKYNLNKRIEFLIMEMDRLIDFYFDETKKIDIYQAFNTSKYIVSLVKALKLLYVYINSSGLIKKEILQSIQKVFDKDRTVEEILHKYEVSLENSLDINVIKKLMM